MKTFPISECFERLLAGAAQDLRAAGTWQMAQVLVTRESYGWELRHLRDGAIAVHLLQEISMEQLRDLSNKTEEGAFRPLKSAPNLRAGWVLKLSSDLELEESLNILYPGALADWNAARKDNPPVTHYRDYTARQTGMYRVTAMLSDAQAASVTTACCDAHFCLKRRFWTVPGLEPDLPVIKSIIPCLEPCSILLEFARKAMRLEQENQVPLTLSEEEAGSLKLALSHLLKSQSEEVREGDVSNPANPRRIRLLLEKLNQAFPVA